MSQTDTGKLAATFLLVATIAASGGVMLSSVPPPASRERGSGVTANGPAAPKSAFVESPREIGGPPTASAAAALALTSSTQNLTAMLAAQIAEQLAIQGPDELAQGQFGGDTQAFADMIANYARDPSAADELGVTPAAVSAPRVMRDYSGEDVVRYAEAVIATVNGRFAESGPPIRDMNDWAREAWRLSLEGAIADVEGLLVPAPLATLHRNTLRSFTELRAYLALDHTASDDPLRDLGVSEARAEMTRAAFRDMRTSVSALRVAAGSSDDAPGFALILANLTGARTAHAVGPIPVPVDCVGPVFCPSLLASLGVTIGATWLDYGVSRLEFARLIALQEIKDRLIHELVKQTIEWIQGGGKPQFITNWKRFLGDAADATLGNFLYTINPQLCSSFGPLIQVAIQPVNPAAGGIVQCTLTQIVGNVRAFAQNFANGGWIAYGAALEPQNNFFGALIQTADVVGREGAAATLQKIDAKVSRGFLSTRKCVNEKSKFQLCREACRAKSLQDPTTLCACDLALQNERVCLEWETTTPGQTLKRTVDDAVAGSPIHRIVNAEDAAALVSAFVNYLTNIAITKLVGLSRSSSGAYTSINPGLAAVRPYDPASTVPDFSACNNVPDDYRDECIDEICRGSGYALPPCPPGGWKPPPVGGGEFCPGTTGSIFSGEVRTAITTFSSGNPSVMTPDGGCNPPWHTLPGQDDAYVNGVVAILNSLPGIAAIGGQGDEISVKKTDNSCEEQFDILTSAGCARVGFLYGISPPDF